MSCAIGSARACRPKEPGFEPQTRRCYCWFVGLLPCRRSQIVFLPLRTFVGIGCINGSLHGVSLSSIVVEICWWFLAGGDKIYANWTCQHLNIVDVVTMLTRQCVVLSIEKSGAIGSASAYSPKRPGLELLTRLHHWFVGFLPCRQSQIVFLPPGTFVSIDLVKRSLRWVRSSSILVGICWWFFAGDEKIYANYRTDACHVERLGLRHGVRSSSIVVEICWWLFASDDKIYAKWTRQHPTFVDVVTVLTHQYALLGIEMSCAIGSAGACRPKGPGFEPRLVAIIGLLVFCHVVNLR